MANSPNELAHIGLNSTLGMLCDFYHPAAQAITQQSLPSIGPLCHDPSGLLQPPHFFSSGAGRSEGLIPSVTYDSNAGCQFLFPELPPLPPLRPAARADRACLDNEYASEVQTENGKYLLEPQGRSTKKGSSSYRQAHVYSERQRRQGMSSLFATLKSLLPPANFKSDRCTVLTYVIEYVQFLKDTLECLGKTKAELLLAARTKSCQEQKKLSEETVVAKTLCGEPTPGLEFQAGGGSRFSAIPALSLPLDVTVRFWGRTDIFITLTCPRKKGMWPELLSILETQNLDVENVTLSTTAGACFHCIYAKDVDACAVSCNALRSLLLQFVVSEFAERFKTPSDVGRFREMSFEATS